jgi:hypothetical protein
VESAWEAHENTSISFSMKTPFNKAMRQYLAIFNNWLNIVQRPIKSGVVRKSRIEKSVGLFT